MCKYSNLTNGNCNIKNTRCPFVYWCDKRQKWRENESIPKHCGVIETQSIPNGFNKVVSHRNEYIYVDVNNQTIRLINPYDDIPLFVKLEKITEDSYKIVERADQL